MSNTTKPITLKTGETLPKGSKVTAWNVDGRIGVCEVEGRKVRVTSAFKAPSFSTLEKWCDNGACKTPSGKKVEPDGYGPDGSPSWLLILGMI